MASTELSGYDMALYVGGTPAAISGERAASLSVSHSPIDASSKNSQWKTILDGAREWSVSSDGVYVVDDTARVAIVAAMVDGTTIAVELRDTDSHDKYYGTCYVTEFGLNASAGDVTTYSCTLTGSSSLTFSTY